jgi:hypothetical protein
MKRRFLVAIAMMALLSFPAPGSAQQRAARPYAVHEFRLGITLTDFRAIPRLTETTDKSLVQRVVCSNDGKDVVGVERVQPSADLKEAGAIKCGLLVSKPGDEPVIGSLELFGERVECEFLFYRAKNDSDYRLAQITLGFNNRRFTNVINLFRRTYGQPSGFDVDGMTVLGNDLPNATYLWDNRLSTIRLDMFSVALDRMSVIFVHNELWEELGAKLRRIQLPR